jgi:hypothetical protein
VRTAAHLAHEPLLLHLAAELPKRLLELLGILDDYAHNPERIPVARGRCSVKRVAGPAVRRIFAAPAAGAKKRVAPLGAHRDA